MTDPRIQIAARAIRDNYPARTQGDFYSTATAVINALDAARKPAEAPDHIDMANGALRPGVAAS